MTGILSVQYPVAVQHRSKREQNRLPDRFLPSRIIMIEGYQFFEMHTWLVQVYMKRRRFSIGIFLLARYEKGRG
jgi:hypothetical protein